MQRGRSISRKAALFSTTTLLSLSRQSFLPGGVGDALTAVCHSVKRSATVFFFFCPLAAAVQQQGDRDSLACLPHVVVLATGERVRVRVSERQSQTHDDRLSLPFPLSFQQQSPPCRSGCLPYVSPVDTKSLLLHLLLLLLLPPLLLHRRSKGLQSPPPHLVGHQSTDYYHKTQEAV